jgi:hypothetical protein
MTSFPETELATSWRALRNPVGQERWRFVHIADGLGVSFEAGCYFPGARESLIVTFPTSLRGNQLRLPEGKGFDVSLLEQPEGLEGRDGIALIRKPHGSRDIFLLMAVDVLRTIRDLEDPPPTLVNVFLQRVREWQQFMGRSQRLLSPEYQLGLFGELVFLRDLIQSQHGEDSVHFWKGPLLSAQDFLIRGHAIEIKASLSSDRSVAKISSIEQLDTPSSPLYLCAIRLQESDSGVSLVDLVASLRESLVSQSTRSALDARLLLLGYRDEDAAHYKTRKLTAVETSVYHVDEGFPRLRRASVPPQILSVRYTLDLDSLECPRLCLADLLSAIDITTHEP